MLVRLAFWIVIPLGTLGYSQPPTPSPGVDESAPITGRIIDASSQNPIVGGSISAGDASTTSDADGRFSLSLPVGWKMLVVSAPGYLETSIEVLVSAESPELEVFLVPRDLVSEHVEVRAEPPAAEGPATVAVEPERVLTVAGSLDNVFRTVATLPGVTAAGDFGSRLSVRGGTPDQNLTIMDGVEVHNPYRLFGITSAFNPETVANFQLTAGGFSAKYGDRLSSLLVVENRDGRSDFSGSAALSITDANVIFEGAFPRSRGSWLLSGRRTYYDLIADKITGNDFPSFGDLQARLSWQFGPGHRLSLFGLRSREGSDLDIDGDFPGETAVLFSDAGNDLVSLSFEAILGERSTSRTIASWYRNVDFIDFDGTLRAEARRSNAPGDEAYSFSDIIFDRELSVRDVSVRQELLWQTGNNHLFETGAEIHDLDTGIRLQIDGDRNVQAANGSSVRGGVGLPNELDSMLTGVRGGAWIQDTVDLMSRWTIVPGIRFDWSTANERTTLSPRLATTFDLSSSSTLGAAVGIYTQSPGYEKLLQSDYFIDLTTAALDLDYEKAAHVIVSFEKDIGRGITTRVEGYYKAFDRLVIGRLETEEERLARLSRYNFPPELQDSIPAEPIITSYPSGDSGGRAYGVDLYVERKASPDTRWSGWVAYTLGKAEREAYGRRYPFEYDRPHALSIVGGYRFGPRFDVAVTGRVSSGFPRTPVLGLRVAAVEDVDDRNGNGDLTELVPEVDAEGNLVYTPDYGGVENLNTARLPAYIRFDVRGTYTPGGPSGRWSFYFEVINVVNRDNALNFEPKLEFDPTSEFPRLTEKPSEAFPLLPTFGIRFRF